jgi:large subunit ribosomal protein L10
VNRQEKEAFVSEMHEKLSTSQVVFLTDYRGLTAENMNELRGSFRDAGIEYRVVKNNLLKRAAEGTELTSMVTDLVGPTGVVIAESDPVGASKVIAEFMKKFPVFAFKTGVLRGKEMTEADIAALSKLPPRDVLLAQLAGTLNSVPAGLVNVLAGVVRKFVYALMAVKDAKEAGNVS